MLNPVMVSDKTKKQLRAYKHENEDKIIDFSKENRRFASWDKTIQYLLFQVAKKDIVENNKRLK